MVFSRRKQRDSERERPVLGPELMARVHQVQIRTHRLVNTALSGGYRSTFRGQGIEFEEVRLYQPGDDVRSIDWNVTARAGQAYIKTYSEERELTLNLLVDSSLSMDFGSGEFTKRDIAAQFAALISFVAIRQQDRVGLCLFGEEPGLALPARKGSKHILRIIREVLAHPPSAGGSDLQSVIEQQSKVLRRRSVVFLVSDFLEQGAERGPERGKDWVQRLTELGRRHDVIAVRVTDPLENALPTAGLVDLREIETGRHGEVDARSAAVRESWERAAQGRRERVLADLSRARADVIELSTAGSVADPVIAFFRGRLRKYGGHA